MIKEVIRQRMIDAMKAKDKKTKEAYAYLLDQIQKAEKALMSEKNPTPKLNESEEVDVIKKVVKQIKAGVDKTLANAAENGVKAESLENYIADRQFEINLYSEFLPEEMSEDQIMAVIQEVVSTLPSPVNKGMLMKNLMPKVKGKADGKLVSTLVENYLKTLN